MARAGRKRKIGTREANGRIKRPTVDMLNEMNLAKAMAETAIVRAQPHRRGSDAPECSSALGRLWLSLQTHDRTIMHAGESYGELVRRYRKAWGMIADKHPDPLATDSEGPTFDDVAKWKSQIDAVDAKLMSLSFDVMSATKRLVLDGTDAIGAARNNALLGLRVIAIEWGMVRKDHPFR